MLRGADKHSRRLRKMRQSTADEVYKAIYAGADIIRTEAVLSIVRGAVQGKGHVPSRPGQPPKRDTGQLDSSIHVEGDRANLRALVVADAPYALALELGTSRMAERPFMRPAAKKKRREVLGLVRLALNRAREIR